MVNTSWRNVYLDNGKRNVTIPELQEKKLIEWPLHVVKDMGAYDMILGCDVMSFLGIDILFSPKVVTLNGSKLPFKPVSADVDKDYHVDVDGKLWQIIKLDLSH